MYTPTILFLNHDFRREFGDLLQRGKARRSARADMLDSTVVYAGLGARSVTKAEQESSPTRQMFLTAGFDNRLFAFDHCFCLRSQDRVGVGPCEACPSQQYLRLYTHEFQSASLEGVLNFL